MTSGEYIQMSGRAGRRGIDDRGIVILMVDEKMSPSVGKQIVKVTKTMGIGSKNNVIDRTQNPIKTMKYKCTE